MPETLQHPGMSGSPRILGPPPLPLKPLLQANTITEHQSIETLMAMEKGGPQYLVLSETTGVVMCSHKYLAPLRCLLETAGMVVPIACSY